MSTDWRVQSEVAKLCMTLCNPIDCSLPSSSIHGIFQARVLEWVAISFSGYRRLRMTDENEAEQEIWGQINGDPLWPVQVTLQQTIVKFLLGKELIYIHFWRKWQPTPVLLPGKCHGRRSLIGYNLWYCKESDITERLHFHFIYHSTCSINAFNIAKK